MASAILLAVVGCSMGGVSAPVSNRPLHALPPLATEGTDTLQTGSVSHPALTSEGDAVKAELPGGGTVVVTVTGPEVPGEGLPYQAGATTCTWTLTFTRASRAVPLAVTDFTAFDQLGMIYHPEYVSGQVAPPVVLEPGASTTFELRAVMKVGEGLMRWAPGGTNIVAKWDFEVETD